MAKSIKSAILQQLEEIITETLAGFEIRFIGDTVVEYGSKNCIYCRLQTGQVTRSYLGEVQEFNRSLSLIIYSPKDILKAVSECLEALCDNLSYGEGGIVLPLDETVLVRGQFALDYPVQSPELIIAGQSYAALTMSGTLTHNSFNLSYDELPDIFFLIGEKDLPYKLNNLISVQTAFQPSTEINPIDGTNISYQALLGNGLISTLTFILDEKDELHQKLMAIIEGRLLSPVRVAFDSSDDHDFKPVVIGGQQTHVLRSLPVVTLTLARIGD